MLKDSEEKLAHLVGGASFTGIQKKSDPDTAIDGDTMG
jgi:hypothetical protein